MSIESNTGDRRLENILFRGLKCKGKGWVVLLALSGSHVQPPEGLFHMRRLVQNLREVFSISLGEYRPRVDFRHDTFQVLFECLLPSDLKKISGRQPCKPYQKYKEKEGENQCVKDIPCNHL